MAKKVIKQSLLPKIGLPHWEGVAEDVHRIECELKGRGYTKKWQSKVLLEALYDATMLFHDDDGISIVLPSPDRPGAHLLCSLTEHRNKLIFTIHAEDVLEAISAGVGLSMLA